MTTDEHPDSQRPKVVCPRGHTMMLSWPRLNLARDLRRTTAPAATGSEDGRSCRVSLAVAANYSATECHPLADGARAPDSPLVAFTPKIPQNRQSNRDSTTTLLQMSCRQRNIRGLGSSTSKRLWLEDLIRCRKMSLFASRH
jgi:hypothetical protein